MQRLNAPDPQVAAFRQKLRHELNLAHDRQSLKRWRRAALGSAGLAVVLALALVWPATGRGASDPVSGLDTFLAEQQISAASDRAFVEDYYARRGESTTVRSIDDERLVAVREFTMSDGRKMVVYTEVGEGESGRSALPVDDRLAMLASRSTHTF